ncbi:MAG: HAD family hydrolase [Fimbriimonadaceae bacterium]|nr:HAD family hydrolase [Fimbriimonadaceae bacterium]
MREPEPTEAPSPEPSAPLAGVRAVYFDLDDTLCGYWDAAKEGLLSAFEKHRPGDAPQEWVLDWGRAFHEFSPTVKKEPWREHYLRSGQETRTELMRRTLARRGIRDEALAQSLSTTYAEERNERLSLFPEALGVLQALHGRYPLGLITNGPADVQREEIETLGIGEYFENVFIEGELGEGKPHLSVFRLAEEAVGETPDRLLFVGNSYGHDIAPANAAGWHTVWVRRPSDVAPSSKTGRPEEVPEGSPRPEYVIADLRELLPLLGPSPVPGG